MLAGAAAAVEWTAGPDPATSGLASRCSPILSYVHMEARPGIEPGHHGFAAALPFGYRAIDRGRALAEQRLAQRG